MLIDRIFHWSSRSNDKTPNEDYKLFQSQDANLDLERSTTDKYHTVTGTIFPRGDNKNKKIKKFSLLCVFLLSNQCAYYDFFFVLISPDLENEI